MLGTTGTPSSARAASVREWRPGVWTVFPLGAEETFIATRVGSALVVVQRPGGRIVGEFWTLGHFLKAWGLRRD